MVVLSLLKVKKCLITSHNNKDDKLNVSICHKKWSGIDIENFRM